MTEVFIFGQNIDTYIMIGFQQWLGFLLFAGIGLAGFWVFLFLLGILPYWIFGHFQDLKKQKKAAKEELKA